MNISQELSDKLWKLAESQDPKAIEAFLTANPQLKSEFQARLKMVSSIKGAKPVHKKVGQDRFMPSPRPLSSGPPRWAAAVAATVLVSGAVLATLGTLRYVESKTTPPAPLRIDQVRGVSGENGTQPTRQPLELPEIENNLPTGIDPGDQQPIIAVRAIDRPITIVAKSISLSGALNDIGLQAGVRLHSAPGMPDPIITLDFRGAPAIQVLQGLGQKFGFTPMIETDDSILLIPARDPNSTNSPNLPGFAGSASTDRGDNSGLRPVPTQNSTGPNDVRELDPNERR